MAQRLAGPGDVAVDLGRDLVLAQGRVRAHEIERLLATPAHRVDAGVDHQPARAPGGIAQLAEALVGRAVNPHLVAEFFGIGRPALTVGRDVAVATEGRLFALLGGERQLQVMTRDRLMQSQRWQRVQRATVELVGVDPVPAGLG